MTKTKNKINQCKCVKVLVGSTIFMMFLYVYLVNSIAFNAAERENMVDDIAVLKSEISDMESQLIAERRGTDRSRAEDFGLVKSISDEAVVVVRDGSTRLTFND